MVRALGPSAQGRDIAFRMSPFPFFQQSVSARLVPMVEGLHNDMVHTCPDEVDFIRKNDEPEHGFRGTCGTMQGGCLAGSAAFSRLRAGMRL